jgi:sporulation protein YlmC with PRC-barrel domain
MILSDILGNRVLDSDGNELGRVADARFKLDGRSTPARARLIGLIVSPRSASSFMGYERTGMGRPVIIAGILRWAHRGSFIVDWSEVRRCDNGLIHLRRGFQKRDVVL